MLYGPPAVLATALGDAPGDALVAAWLAALAKRLVPTEVASAPTPIVFKASLRPVSISVFFAMVVAPVYGPSRYNACSAIPAPKRSGSMSRHGDAANRPPHYLTGQQSSWSWRMIRPVLPLRLERPLLSF